MKDWNVVISVYQDGFRRALRALKEFGPVERSPYHNVLLMRVEDPTALLDAIERGTEENTALYDAISRVAPAMRTVEFHSVEEFSGETQTNSARVVAAPDRKFLSRATAPAWG